MIKTIFSLQILNKYFFHTLSWVQFGQMLYNDMTENFRKIQYQVKKCVLKSLDLERCFIKFSILRILSAKFLIIQSKF